MSRDTDQKVKVNPRETPQKIHVTKNFGKIICPSRLLICGPSLSGKSQLIRRMVQYRQDIYSEHFTRIVYASPNCLAGTTDNYVDSLKEHFPELELTSELPNVHSLDLANDHSHKLVIIDDMILKFNNSKNALKLLTIHSHHANSLICNNLYL